MTASLTDAVAILVAGPPATTQATATLREVAADLGNEYRGALLVEEGNQMAGIVSERDIVRAVGDGEDPDELRVSDVMTEQVVTVASTASIGEAMDLMDDNEIRHLAVMDRRQCIGLISQRDLVHHLRGMLEARV